MDGQLADDVRMLAFGTPDRLQSQNVCISKTSAVSKRLRFQIVDTVHSDPETRCQDCRTCSFVLTMVCKGHCNQMAASYPGPNQSFRLMSNRPLPSGTGETDCPTPDGRFIRHVVQGWQIYLHVGLRVLGHQLCEGIQLR